jgi:hypothetical protein
MTLQLHINSTDNTVHKNIHINVRGSILNKGSLASPPGTLTYTSLEAYFSNDAKLQIIEKPSMPEA